MLPQHSFNFLQVFCFVQQIGEQMEEDYFTGRWQEQFLPDQQISEAMQPDFIASNNNHSLWEASA